MRWEYTWMLAFRRALLSREITHTGTRSLEPRKKIHSAHTRTICATISHDQTRAPSPHKYDQAFSYMRGMPNTPRSS
uniref:Uncharacterized protein n=1 Tax=Setaria italica TaxID=4555 RepID=K3ZGC1_SETIT